MVRLWPTFGTLVAVACVSLGCANQNLQGRWRGAFPLEHAKACVLNLYGGSRFDLSCKENSWIGGGHYVDAPDSIEFRFEILTRRGERLAPPPAMRFKLDQKANRLALSDAGTRYELSRGL